MKSITTIVCLAIILTGCATRAAVLGAVDTKSTRSPSPQSGLENVLQNHTAYGLDGKHPLTDPEIVP